MKYKLIVAVCLFFSSTSFAASLHFSGDLKDQLQNISNLNDHPSCSSYLVGNAPPFVLTGMKILVNEFQLQPGVAAIVSDYTCNLLHLFSYEIKNKQLIFNVEQSYRTSGGRGGVSNVKRTGATPPGVHSIWKKQGEIEGWPLNYAIDGSKYGFKSKVIRPTQDKTFWRSKFVMTRILRLKGLEGEKNNNSVARSILIHGTPEEGLLGYHESGGCIRMNNMEVMDLYDQVIEDSLVNIVYAQTDFTMVFKKRIYLPKSQYQSHGLICVEKEKCEKY